MLGTWTASARNWGSTSDEILLLERNARMQVTLWGEPDSSLFDYANHMWSGLIGDFYYARWELFVARVADAVRHGVPLDEQATEHALIALELQWTQQSTAYPTEPVGDLLAVEADLYETYCSGCAVLAQARA